MAKNLSGLANFIWSVTDLLRGDYRQLDYGKVVLPLVLRRRLERVLDGTREKVRKEFLKRKDSGVNLDTFLKRKSGQSFYRVSEFTQPTLLDAMQQHLIGHIDRLREYRSSLSYAAITGQLDLGDFQEAA